MEFDNAERAEPAAGQAPGLLTSLQRLLGSLSEILHTRIEILSTEAAEAGLIAAQLIIYVLVSVIFLVLSLLLLTVFIIKASPEIYQLSVLAGFGVIYLLLAVSFARLLMHKLKTMPRLFSTTLSELEKDRHRLGTRS